MADVIFYSTGEIFWVTDPPENRSEHIGIRTVFPPVPPDEFFTYAAAANALRRAGHRIIGAFGRQRRSVRSIVGQGFRGDPEFLALGALAEPGRTVLVLIATETGNRDEGGVDHFSRLPFTQSEIEAFQSFREKGGGVYVTWDHGQLGYKALEQLGLHGPIETEPEEPLRPNTAHSLDSTDSGKVTIRGVRLVRNADPEPCDVPLSLGPPAGYLQRIIPAQLIYKDLSSGEPRPEPPHPIFNGVGSADGIWIPAHMHEGVLKAKVHWMFKLDESALPDGVRVLALHIPLNETSFNVFPIMAIEPPRLAQGEDGPRIERGAVLWDTSFHHLVDINWSSDGNVPWEPFVPFSAASLWQPQFPPDLFERRIEQGMAKLFANAVAWLGNDLPPAPSKQMAQAQGSAFAQEQRQEQKPSPRDIPEYR
ncbi:MAG: hypothetical protein ACK4SZ_13890 [Allosphingosinicella sp.]|uniref:hypothetical protein n=1 Tax=Allosphingosinicella sp. TaxID=2823234 RepID=UPI0039403B80